MVYKIHDLPTPIELFEDFCKRRGLRGKISNAMMAVALYEVKSESINLPQYISDGIKICQDFLSSLVFIRESQPNFYYRDYPTKVLIDILTDHLRKPLDLTELKILKGRLKFAQEIFEAINKGGELEKEKAKEALGILDELDQEIEATYAVEDNLYRRPRYFKTI